MRPPECHSIRCDLFDESDAQDKIEEWVRTRLSREIADDASLVTIDGWTGAGKTTVAKALAKVLKCDCFELDSYLDRDLGYFLEALQFDKLSKGVKSSIKKSGRCIVEGCLVDMVMERAEITVEFRIYLARISAMISNPLVEHFERYEALFGELSAEKFIERQTEVLKRSNVLFGDENTENEIYELEELEKELIRYTKCRRPHLDADLLIEIVRRA